MKRRVDEVQFGGRNPQRIITAQHSSSIGPNIQYHIGGVLKTADNANIGGPAPTVQYTTTYSQGQPIPNVKTVTGVNNKLPDATIHVVNSIPGAANTLQRHKTGPPGSINTVQSSLQQQPPQPQPIQAPQMQQIQAVPQNMTTMQPAGEKFTRLKVEDALTYLDQVKFKFGNQPQVYNDFLDIMKEFKSQSIDTPGVIQRVSNLFKGHPELIVGFNTFLPPGYKIEVQANDQGVAFQVSVSMPSPSGGNICLQQPTSPHRGNQIIHTMPTIKQEHPILHQQQNLHLTIQQQPPPPQQAPSPMSQTAYSTVRVAGAMPQQANIASINVVGSSGVAQVAGINVATLTGPPPQIADMGHNLHHIPQAHQPMAQTEQQQQQQQQQPPPQGQNAGQPVEFNHAISYVNKIKVRFQAQPEKYKRFLEILHAYQKEQKVLKEGSGNLPSNKLTEAEVYSQVAKLFDQQEDLLREFGQFLPDATNHASQFMSRTVQGLTEHKKVSTPVGVHVPPSVKPYNNNAPNNMPRMERDYLQPSDKDFHRSGPLDKDRNHVAMPKFSVNAVKRSPSFNQLPANHVMRDRDGPSPPKRHKPICRDVSLAEASKYGSLNDYAFFDKVRKALRSPEVYDNFLRCLTLFNQEIISRVELVCLVTPFLNKFPELHRWFQDFLGSQHTAEGITLATAQRQDRNQSEMAQEIDLSTCKRLGASYCALPKSSESRKCSGRTALCREVLNDTWVSFPTWAEDSTFVTSRKTQYEEIIYRCEDERFELDVVIQTNWDTIEVLEGVQKKISRMSQDELAKFKLDDCLGGTSPTIHQRALRRVYGDKAGDIIQGLKKTPQIAVQLVLRRLKAKDEEWREAKKSFNKQWREQNEKYYLKSLDHQGINFKQNDIKALRSKTLFNDIETLYDERHEQNDDSSEPVTGPHLILPYKDKTILDDAANLLIHHVKRQTAIQKQEKTRIKHILRHFIPDLFFWQRQQLSDDERDDVFPFSVDDRDMDADPSDTDVTMTATKSDSLSNAQNASEVKNEQSESNNGKSSTANSDNGNTNTAGARSNETSGHNSPTTVESNSPVSNRIPKSVHSFRDGSDPSRTSDTPRDAELASDPSSANVDIKEELCDSPGAPLPQHAVSKIQEEAYTLFFANTNWYLFLRLHAILCDRLRTMYDRAQQLAIEEQSFRGNRRDSTAVALRLKPMSEIQVEDYYPTFLDMLKMVLDGNMDSNHYEDSLREMFGIHAYIAFTLDRVVTNAVRQLQHCVTERSALDAVELFHTEQRRNGTGGYCRTANKRIAAEMAYQRKAEANLPDDNCFKVYIYKIDCRVTIELLDTDSEDNEKSVQNAKNWSEYVDRIANPITNTNNTTNESSAAPTETTATENQNDAEMSMDIKEEKLDDELMASLPRLPLWLNRNYRQFMRLYKGKTAIFPTPDTSNDPTSTSVTNNVNSIIIGSKPSSPLHVNATTTTMETATVNIDGVESTDDNSIVIKTKLEANATIINETVSSANSNTNEQTLTTKTETSSATSAIVVIDQQASDKTAANKTIEKMDIDTYESIKTTANIAENDNNGTKRDNSDSTNTNSNTSHSNAIDDHDDNDDNNNSSSSTDDTNTDKKPTTTIKSPPLQRTNCTGCNRDYIVNDRSETSICFKKYRVVFVMNKNTVLYKVNSVPRARKMHPTVTKKMSQKFRKFVNKWQDEHISADQEKRCMDWFMGNIPDSIPNIETVKVQVNDETKTPYRPYNRYKVKRTATSN